MSSASSPAQPQNPGSQDSAAAEESGAGLSVAALLVALGALFGDVGISPLYALREVLHAATGPVAAAADAPGAGAWPLPNPAEIIGALSLILWSITVVVTGKYVALLTGMDNRGEGGTLALMALARGASANGFGFLFLGMAGLALYYGDSLLTPALSVLAATEGAAVREPGLADYVLPAGLALLAGLFLLQKRGTAKFQPLAGFVMALWFAAIGISGFGAISAAPQVLLSLNPLRGLELLAARPLLAAAVLGAVFLSIAGAQALYTGLGRFGRRPIRAVWICFAFPCLALNYLGQGALLLRTPQAADNPFFRLAPAGWEWLFVFLSVLAALAVSQAIVTEASSFARQAVNLGLLPRLVSRRTADRAGGTFLPQVNYTLMLGVLLVALMFKTSSALAGAYGICLSGAMAVDAAMVLFVKGHIRENAPRGNSFSRALASVGPFLLLDAVFFLACLAKFVHGGWAPVAAAVLIMLFMTTWVQGTFILSSRARKREIRIEKFIREYRTMFQGLQRVPGSAFFFAGDPDFAPMSLLQNIRHNKILHARNIILTVRVEPVPNVDPARRALITHLNHEFTVVVLRFGFNDELDVQQELIRLNRTRGNGIDFDWEHTSLFLSRRSIKSHPKYGLPGWQDMIYIWLSKLAAEPTDFYKLPVGRVIEIGRHVII